MNHIRNLSIIAHIDHGKTTLTDRLMQTTNTISEREFSERLLDSNPIEKERGITIKLAPVRMQYQHQGETYTINLIDTPGHVDFGYEVSRSLAAGEGAVLLVDATQGLQAQTLSNFDKASQLGLSLVVALNKVDLPSADLEATTADIVDNLGLDSTLLVPVSAKTGLNIDQLLSAIVTHIKPPAGDPQGPARGLVFNSVFHPHKGVVAFVRMVDGSIRAGDQLILASSKQRFEAKEVGYFSPSMKPDQALVAGQVGYVATGLKDPSLVKVGDTITLESELASITPLPGYKEPLPVVYMDIFPKEGKDFVILEEAMQKLALNDAAIAYQPVSSQALGKGFRAGFLGALHAEIVLERVRREYSLELVPTAPTVVYQVRLRNGDAVEVKNPSELPDPSQILQIEEPVAAVSVFSPSEYLGSIIQLLNDHRGELVNQTYYGARVKLEYLVPLSELIVHFYDSLKSVSQGYASLEYEPFAYQPVDAVKLSILINKQPIEALAQIVVREKAVYLARRMVATLKEAIPRQLVEIPIQASVGGTVVARETIKAFRKDVTAKLYGGDITRRKKLLEKQKKGKAFRSQFASVEIPQEAYLAVLKR